MCSVKDWFRPVTNKELSSATASVFLMSKTRYGAAVTERSAMQMTAVYACLRILAESITGLPLSLYRYSASGGKEKATSHPFILDKSSL